MATLFIALQCCQCSTMQVKQQKKSSNKWACAVCNQRQSVRRIHASGHVAHDLRQFVQAFNMTRPDIASDDGPHPTPPQSDSPRALSAAVKAGGAVAQTKRRTDWSDYLDAGDNGRDVPFEMEGELCAAFEPKVVTEMPEGKWRRGSSVKCTPRAQSSAGLERKSSFSFKPAFAKRKRLQPGPEESRELGGGNAAAKQAKGGSSRWSEYLEEGDVFESIPREGGGHLYCSSLDAWNGTSLKQFDEVAVEEEVHPAFK